MAMLLFADVNRNVMYARMFRLLFYRCNSRPVVLNR